MIQSGFVILVLASAMVTLAALPLNSTNKLKRTSKEAALLVVENWAAALGKGDLEAIVQLFSEKVVFLGTSSKKIVTNIEGVRDYFTKGLKDFVNLEEFKIAHKDHTTIVLSESIVTVAVLDSFISKPKNGNKRTIEGRLTFVIEKQATGWKIVLFHRSQMPQ